MNDNENEQNDLNQNFDSLMDATPQLDEQMLQDDMRLQLQQLQDQQLQISHFEEVSQFQQTITEVSYVPTTNDQQLANFNSD